MTLNDIKETLEAIGYPAKGDNANDLLGDLHTKYGSTKVGSSINQLGNAAPLYVRSGNVAHLVDNEQDLSQVCIQISQRLREKAGAKPVTIAQESRSRWLVDVRQALEHEIELRQRTKRPLGFDPSDFPVTSDALSRQSRSSDKIIDGLLSTKRDAQLKALSAFRSLMAMPHG